MRRLSIIDLGGGSQPVFNEDGTIGVVFNGEIYNFPDLRATARNSRPPVSHPFRHRSDRSCLRGMGRALPRASPRHVCLRSLGRPRSHAHAGPSAPAALLLARDRLGIKPLYYAAADGTLLFASEVRALLASGAIPRKVARESVEAYLLFGSVVEPMTLVEGVFSLPPGHSLMLSPATRLLRPSPSPTGISRIRRARLRRMRRATSIQRPAPCAPCWRKPFAAISWRMSRSAFS